MTEERPTSADAAQFDYVVVGSGAGGGTVAARLAESGMRVLVLEAGGDPRNIGGRMPDDYDVPAFHAFASEHPQVRWDLFVRHFADDESNERVPSMTPHGILYPRARALGGCTAINALLFARPHASFWDQMAAFLGESSWSAANMENYWRRVESCNYRPGWRRLRRLGLNSTGHGWRGWTFSERGYRQLFRDMQLVDVILSAAKGLGYRPSDAINLLGLPPFVATVVRRGGKFAKTLLKTFVPVASAIFDYSDPVTEFISERGWLKRFWWLLDDPLDPNDRRLTDDPSHIGYVPLSTRSHRRFGTRERLLDVACRRPDRLHVQLNALATRVILDKDNRAIGIEYLQRERSNVDDPIGKDERQDPQQVLAARGVILACGAFNTPQLLMLSGIGPKVVLERVQICPRIDLPGVGRNLRDHYEINVIQRMKANWLSRKGSRYEKGDEQYQHWKRGSDGSYAFTGAVLALARKSDSSNIAPDMLITALLYPFKGYYRGYSRVAAEIGDVLTWSIMKSMSNGDGVVTLRSADPCDAPVVDFNYFVGDSRNDLRSLVDGIRFVRELTAKLTQKRLIIEEEAPGKDFIADEELIQFARDTASGRNAAGSCGIGPVAAGGVLDSDFRVHGTKGLYVVDASALPRLPCCHIASTIYMAAEKAADGILREATGSKAVLKF